jgi:hypothetical protein
MSEVSNDTAGEINRLHQLAAQKAIEAINYAKKAGLLLLEVKKELPHGKFGLWIEANLEVSVRQAQRYMNVASGKEASIRALATRYDTTSHLQAAFYETELEQITDPAMASNWLPEVGHWYCTDTEHGAYWVVPDANNPELFHISRLYGNPENDGEGLFDGTRWPEVAEKVESRLRNFGLSNAHKAAWKFRQKTGLSAPFGAPEDHGKIIVTAPDGSKKRLCDAF